MQSPAEAAEVLYARIPHALTSAQLEEYGIQAGADQVRQFTREILALTLYWIWSALDSVFTARRRDRVFAALQERIRAGWDSELNLKGHDVEQFFEELRERLATYTRVMEEERTPVGVCAEAARMLAWSRAVPSEDRQKVLALLVDLIPVDEIGEVAGDLDLGEG